MFSGRARISIRLFSVFTSAVLYAQVEILPVSISSSPESRLSQLVIRSASLEATQAGFIVSEPLFLTAPKTDGEIAAAIPKTSTAHFFLFLRSEQTGENLELEMLILRAKDRSEVVRRKDLLTVNLNLDTSIGTSVRNFLRDPVLTESSRSLAAKIETAPIPQAPKQQPTPPDPSPPAVSGPQPSPEAASAPGFIFGLQGSPYLFVGDLSEIFRYGAGVSLFGAYRLPGSKIAWGPGVRTEFIRLFPVEGAQDGSVYLILSGIEMKAGPVQTAQAGMEARFGGGPSVIILNKPSEELLAKTVPFVEAGLSAHMPVSLRIDLGIDLGVLAVFDDKPLFGFSPAVLVRFRP